MIPPLTQAPIEHVDLTPDAELPTRILQAYLDNCACRFDLTGVPPEEAGILVQMNADCERRAVILRQALIHLHTPPHHKDYEHG